MAMPAFAVSLYLLAAVMRMTRTSMLEVLGEDFVRTAWAKGAGRRRVLWSHALRNALIPVVTLIGAQIGNLMSGSTVVEVVFGLPGVGNTLVSATYNRDYPVVEATAVFLAAVFVVLNLVVDLLYGVLDPRIEV
jgi:peptide/nickel transport system permease protein